MLRIVLVAEGLAPWREGEAARLAAALVRHLGPLCGELLVGYDGPDEARVRRELGPGGNVRLLRVQGDSGGPAGDGGWAWSERARAALDAGAGPGGLASWDVVYALGLTGRRFTDHPRLVVHAVEPGEMEMAGGWPERARTWRKGRRAQALQRAARAVVSASALLQAKPSPNPLSPQFIPNPIPGDWLTARPVPRMRGPLRALFVGEKGARHGYDLLARALHALPQPIVLDLVGPLPAFAPGPHEVTFHGPLTDRERRRALIDAADVVVAPFRDAGLPLPLLEALARGRHVIATDVGAIPALLAEAPGCLLIPPTAAALTQALTHFAASPPEPRRWNLSRFTGARIAMDHARLFQRLAAEPAPQP